ncbi:hypothetical protein HNQ91_004625 [Filimonas zeae]|uniref:Uncharacterized protein n=1 Tax=Filimonas zeae TaxID=1737353 RepID=A0A917MXG9_9BACT|nr:hypothetical protein [Filimonas zeae]MDR6341552.1 hypothetical protein [Filimonas zeae]GGH75305.1 hypothetical protein GCM10011379_38760 [Filimonas zeae]
MNNPASGYECQERKSYNGLEFFFISKGERDVIKAVEFSFVQKLDGRDIYNLGFGDYDLESDTVTDSVYTNNGDAYKVFNTVLNCIPIFFESYKSAMLMVQGSDGGADFIEQCRLVCVKRCGSRCKNYNRRISVYQGYVNKNFELLSTDYQFFGGFRTGKQATMEPYVPFRKYDVVLLLSKKA